MKNYVLTKRLFTRNKHLHICRQCGEALKVGDPVTSTGNNNHMKLSHQACFEKLYYEVTP